MFLQVNCPRKCLPCLKSSNTGGPSPPPNSTFWPRCFPFRGASGFPLSSLSAPIPWDLVLNCWEGSCLSNVHHTLQSARAPFFPSAASCKLLALYGAANGLGVQSDPSSLLAEGGRPVYFDRDSGLLSGWLRKPQHTAGQTQGGLSGLFVMLAWSLPAMRDRRIQNLESICSCTAPASIYCLQP